MLLHVRLVLVFASIIPIVHYAEAALHSNLDVDTTCAGLSCINGECRNTVLGPMCFCDQGWRGLRCDACQGLAVVVIDEKLTYQEGYISDGYGNYSLENKCSWYIPYTKGGVVRLRLEHFATECSWDYLYVFDGMSIYAPLLGVFSGLLVTNKKSRDALPEMVSESGAVFLHFFSDLAYNMTGFNISLSVGHCPYKCSGRGVCNHYTKTCRCTGGYIGEGCQHEQCPNACSQHGVCTQNGCQCHPAYHGEDCSKETTEAAWEPVHYVNEGPAGQASHKTVVVGDDMWVLSGHMFKQQTHMTVSRFRLTTHRWEHKPLESSYPVARYGHTVVSYKNKLYMFGGLVNKQTSAQLWEYDIRINKWTLKKVTSTSSDAITGVIGHTAHMVNSTMLVIFGYNTRHGYISTVQECDFDSSFKWHVPSMTGAIVQGSYGHSSVYDSQSGLILVHGGYQPVNIGPSSATNVHLSDSLYAYNVRTKAWQVLRSSGQPRLLHTALIVDGMMLVFGGNVHTDTGHSTGAKCFSNNFMAFDIGCDLWHKLDVPAVQARVDRFGHEAAVYNRSMYIFGGFSGMMLNDLYVFKPGVCEHYKDKDTCLKMIEGVRCSWTDKQGCVAKQLYVTSKKGLFSPPICSYKMNSQNNQNCKHLETCSSCVASSFACYWCGTKCIRQAETCHNADIAAHAIRTVDECIRLLPHLSSNCSLYHNCRSCLQHPHCTWFKPTGYRASKCYYKASVSENDLSRCPVSCDERATCRECTLAPASSCMWCSNRKQCVPSNAYVTNFPYGQCMEWSSKPNKCPAQECLEHKSCYACRSDPACGWCDDGSKTGLGVCMEGGGDGPINVPNKNNTIATRGCPIRDWSFGKCPLCQCNGHSVCLLGSYCQQCRHNTAGSHCERCQDGYYGNALFGGKCYPCKCNGQADSCNHKTGDCYCRTKGVMGKQCDKCDESRQYYGKPKMGGTCYYDLRTNYEFTFNLTKDVDKHYSQINFMNMPLEAGKEVKFSINCSATALFNLTLVSKKKKVPTATLR